MNLHDRLPPLETRDEGNDDPLAAATRAVEELRTANEAFRSEQATAAERHATEVRGLTDRIAGLETRLNRPGAGGEQQQQAPIDVRAFRGFLRHGREGLAADEVRALRVSDGPAGGYLAPDQFDTELLRNLVEISPIRVAARVTNTSAPSVTIPKRTSNLTAKWVGELEERPRTEPTYGQVSIPANEIACYVDVSNQLLEDSAVNLEAELSIDFAEEFGRLEGAAFVNGDGNSKPSGILNSPVVPKLYSGVTSQIPPEALINTMYDLPALYRNRGVWLMNGRAIAYVRMLQDGNGRFLWQDNLAADQPPTLLGRPVVEAVDMPDIGVDANAIVFGDIQSAYRIVDRVGLSVLRDPYSQATNGLTRFHARRRVGGGVVRPDALRKLVTGAKP